MSQLELSARPLRRDGSGIMAQLLMVAAVVLCPLLLVPWLWYRRERYWLNRCRLRVEGSALLVYYQQRQLMALDLRYATRQSSGTGDLVLSEGDAHYLALGVDPPEDGYPDSADLSDPPAPARAVRNPPRNATWRAVRLAQADLLRLGTFVAAVPTRQLPDTTDVWSLLQALGSVGATGRQAEGQLARLVQTDRAQARPSGLLTMLHERALEEGPIGTAARRVLSVRTLGP